MKKGTLYAGRVKKAFAKVKHSGRAPTCPDADDPLRQLAVGVLGVTCGDKAAMRAVDRLLSAAVDWNEVRVSTPLELHQAIDDCIPDGIHRCQQLLVALQSVFDRANRMTLDHLKGIGRREARQYLDELDGVDEYTAAGVVLWSLGGHAIPVNDPLLRTLKEADLVHPDATRGEVQAFLERHIPAADAKEFCLRMRDFVPGKASGDGASRKSTKRKSKAGTKKRTTAKRSSKRAAKGSCSSSSA